MILSARKIINKTQLSLISDLVQLFGQTRFVELRTHFFAKNKINNWTTSKTPFSGLMNSQLKISKKNKVSKSDGIPLLLVSQCNLN